MSKGNTVDFTSLFRRLRPASILFIGRAGRELFDEYLGDFPDCRFDVLDHVGGVEELSTDCRYDLVFVMQALEYMNKEQATMVIARLRDVVCRQLIVVVPPGDAVPGQKSRWQAEDLRALGMVAIGEGQAAGQPFQVFGFDIMTYKTTPDWLNSRYWAHPELFGRFWW